MMEAGGRRRSPARRCTPLAGGGRSRAPRIRESQTEREMEEEEEGVRENREMEDEGGILVILRFYVGFVALRGPLEDARANASTRRHV